MFDESAATYIGSAGAVKFFEESEGPNSPDAVAARGVLEADLKFADFLKSESERLLKLYQSGLPREEILKRRVAIFAAINADYARLRPQLSGLERFDLDKQPLNNAILINYLIYFHDLDNFAKLERVYGGNLHDTIKAIIALAESDRVDPFYPIWQATHAAAQPTAALPDKSTSTPSAAPSRSPATSAAP
jgi:predicted aminopeptidase